MLRKPTSYGERLRELMRKKNMTTSQLALRIGITTRSVNKLLNDEVAHPRRTNEIAKVLGTTHDYLAYGKEDKNDPNLESLFNELRTLNLKDKQIEAIRATAFAMAE